MSNTNGDNAPKQIQVSLSICVPQPLHVTLNNHDWILVIGQKGRGQIALPDLHGLIVGYALEIHKKFH
jgi:hypothetical protein